MLEVNLTAPFLMIEKRSPGHARPSIMAASLISSSSAKAGWVKAFARRRALHGLWAFAGLLGLQRARPPRSSANSASPVNAICPGMIDNRSRTREHASDEFSLEERLAASYPVPRLGTALEVADLTGFLLQPPSEAAGYITGTSLDINGGRF